MFRVTAGACGEVVGIVVMRVMMVVLMVVAVAEGNEDGREGRETAGTGKSYCCRACYCTTATPWLGAGQGRREGGDSRVHLVLNIRGDTLRGLLSDLLEEVRDDFGCCCFFLRD